MDPLPQDVVRLVIAARNLVFSDERPTPCSELWTKLDQASEAFASRVAWDDEPEQN